MLVVVFVVGVVFEVLAAVDDFFPELGDLSPDDSGRRSLGCKKAVIGCVDRMCGFVGVSPTSKAFNRLHSSSLSRSFLFSLNVFISNKFCR